MDSERISHNLRINSIFAEIITTRKIPVHIILTFRPLDLNDFIHTISHAFSAEFTGTFWGITAIYADNPNFL